jgi:electron transfer flavoprotein alpha subunit
LKPTLIVAPSVSGVLDDAAYELATAAAVLGGPVILGVAARNPNALASTGIAGVERAVGVRLPNDRPGHEVVQRAVETLMHRTAAGIVLMPFNWDTAAFAAAIAERRGAAFASDVIDVSRDAGNAIVVTRPIYGGKMRVRLRIPPGVPAVLLLRAGCWPPAPSTGVAPTLEIAEAELSGASRVRLLKVIPPAAGEDDLARADVIFAVGRGIGTAENIALIADIARKFGASLGASRPVVDLGLLPRSRQVGQSGATVKPRLYVALGISGSVQHLAGMAGSRTIVAVNTDQDAPIFEVAHFGAAVDAMEVARKLLSEA